MNVKDKQKHYLEFLILLNPLIIECNILAILPRYTKCLLHKFYALLIQILLIVGFIHSIYGKQSPSFDTYSPTVKIIDQISNLLLTLTVCAVTVLTIFCFPKKLRNLYNKMAEFDDIMRCFCPKRKSVFWISYSLLHVFVMVTIALDSWVWLSSIGYTMYKYYLVRNFQYLQLSVAVYLIFWIAMEIFLKFKLLNEALLETYRERYKTPFDTQEDLGNRVCKIYIYKQLQLRDIAKLHGLLCDLLNNFNWIFGVIILFTILFYTTYMLQYTVEMITYTIMKDTVNGASFGGGMMILCIIWIIECLITLIGLATSGNRLCVEANKTTAICYKILNDFVGDDLFKEELKVLAQQSFSRNPSLSAFGFFDVNYAMMGFIVTSVTSYIIVAIQFLT